MSTPRIGLLGRTVKVEIPGRHGSEWVRGEVTGYGLPLVEIRADGRLRYRHLARLQFLNDSPMQ
jgi:hypothetical protein